MKRPTMAGAVLVVLALVPATVLLAQLGGAGWLALPVSGDPGISWMVVADTPKGGANHTFTSVGTATATILEVFGK